jgi:hypothetical protein
LEEAVLMVVALEAVLVRVSMMVALIQREQGLDVQAGAVVEVKEALPLECFAACVQQAYAFAASVDDKVQSFF